jgi:type VI protein secretion system component Hcp
MSARSTLDTVVKAAVMTALTIAFSLASAGEALAQRAFLFVQAIPGDSTVEGYVDWIAILSIRQSATATTRRSIACDISVVKNIDVAGPALWATAASGVTIPEMLISVLKSGAETNTKLYDIRLTNVRITAVQASTAAADTSETVTLMPQGVTLTYYTQTPTGSPGAPVTQSFACQ